MKSNIAGPKVALIKLPAGRERERERKKRRKKRKKEIMKARYNIVDRAGKEGIEKGERMKETRGKE